jgi:hypothetical protein
MTTAIPIFGTTTPATADPCLDWHNGADMINSSCGRRTFILDPGQGATLSRATVLQHRPYYENKGFSANFLWYAPEGNRRFDPGNTERWSGCTVDMPTGQTCTPGEEEFHRLTDAFSDDDHNIPILLPSLSFGTGFIALTCGNFSERSDSPVPVISGNKFHDQNRNGVRDPGEPGLSGWTVTLWRDRSDDGQDLGFVTTMTTDTRSISWQPEDIKPLSFPSSVNLKKEGAVPVAILSTVEFDAVALVDRQTLTFGATGLESSWLRCGSPGEDVNGDGLLDLICQFDTKKTGLTCTSTSATVMGYSTDGRRFEGQDDIKITGC